MENEEKTERKVEIIQVDKLDLDIIKMESEAYRRVIAIQQAEIELKQLENKILLMREYREKTVPKGAEDLSGAPDNKTE